MEKKNKKILTLCVVHNDTHILLGMKKRGFGQGRWNGFGGKVEENEVIKAAAKRELQEEAHITPKDIKKRGVLNFEFEGNPQMLEVHIFSISDFEGQPAESDEMIPQWFPMGEIPYGTMWPDDKHWLPLLLEGKNFKGTFYFQDNNTLVRHHIKEV